MQKLRLNALERGETGQYGNSEDLLDVEIDLGLVEKVRSKISAWDDRRTDLFELLNYRSQGVPPLKLVTQFRAGRPDSIVESDDQDVTDAINAA